MASCSSGSRTCGFVSALSANHCHVAKESSPSAAMGASGKYHSGLLDIIRVTSRAPLTSRKIWPQIASGQARVATPYAVAPSASPLVTTIQEEGELYGSSGLAL